jgi:4-amino-4-deoxy-L-arabinose transferase
VILARPFRLLLLFVLFVLVPLGLRPMWIPDESRYAEIAREMLESGNWVVPTLLGMHYFEKPVAGYWFTAFSQAVLGENLFASRLPAALATGFSAIVVAVLAHRMWHDPRKTWIAVLVYLSFALVSGMALYITLDPQLAFWLNLALLAFHVATTTAAPGRRLAAWAMLGAACGMAFLTKGFVAWLLAVLVAVPYMLWQRRLGELLRLGPVAALVAVAIAAFWGLAVQREAPDFWNQFFWNEHIRRFAGANAQHSRPFWFYLPVLVLGCLPWLGILVPALRRAWAEKRDPNIGFLVIWFLFPLVFLSLARGKLPTYILPCLTPLALLVAHALARQLDHGLPGKLLKINAGINGVIGIAGLALLLVITGRGVYAVEDRTAWLLAAAIGLVWLLVAVAQWRRPLRYWELSALPLWLLWACLPQLLTQDQIDSKQPSEFIQSHMGTLRQTDFLLGNNAGLSADLAWNLGRTDITVYATKDELQYGLATPAGSGRFVSHDEIGAWIASARRQGSVALVLRVSGADDPDLTALPEGATLCDLRNKLALAFYPRVTTP